MADQIQSFESCVAFTFLLSLIKTTKKVRLIIWFFKKYISKLPLARSHSDWMERPEVSKESIGLGGRSTFREINIPKRKLPLYLITYLYQPNNVLFWAGLFGPTSVVVLVRLKLGNKNSSIYTNHLDRFKLVSTWSDLIMFDPVLGWTGSNLFDFGQVLTCVTFQI